VSRHRRRTLVILGSGGLAKRFWWHTMPWHTGDDRMLIYQALRHSRVCHIGVRDSSRYDAMRQ
jgi:hypothetical protein